MKVKLLGKIPKYQTKGSAGFDIDSTTEGYLQPGDHTIISTGLFMEIPEGYELQIRPRSGLALTHGITVLNSPGTIDSDYRGEIKIILINHSSEPFLVTYGMRIAQGVFAPVIQAEFEPVEQLTKTERTGGFGSTGK